MEIVEKVSKLVKPLTPTPSILRKYDISFYDQKVVNMNIPLMLYYSTSHKEQNDVQTNIFNHLEISLSKTLVEFYPLAGRYMRHGSFIDCSDQGALYVQTQAKFQLSEFLSLESKLKQDMLQDFLSCELVKAGEINDPLLSIKVTTFTCGGVAIGMCMSHKFGDMDTFCTFINNWASKSREVGNELQIYSPVFNSPYHLSKINPLNDVNFIVCDVNIVLRVFSFKGAAITALREKLMIKDNKITHRISKVQLIVALLWKAFVNMDIANEQWKESMVCQSVNLRNVINPKAPENFCGNFCSFANAQTGLSKRDNAINFHILLQLLHDSFNKIRSNYATVLSHSEKDYEVLAYPALESYKNSVSNDVNVHWFSSWCKFPFYTADFGWGKPVWRSTINMKIPNTVIMMDDEEGDGVEAWVHLDKKQMYELEQDPDIQAYLN